MCVYHFVRKYYSNQLRRNGLLIIIIGETIEKMAATQQSSPNEWICREFIFCSFNYQFSGDFLWTFKYMSAIISHFNGLHLNVWDGQGSTNYSHKFFFFMLWWVKSIPFRLIYREQLLLNMCASFCVLILMRRITRKSNFFFAVVGKQSTTTILLCVWFLCVHRISLGTRGVQFSVNTTCSRHLEHNSNSEPRRQ